MAVAIKKSSRFTLWLGGVLVLSIVLTLVALAFSHQREVRVANAKIVLRDVQGKLSVAAQRCRAAQLPAAQCEAAVERIAASAAVAEGGFVRIVNLNLGSESRHVRIYGERTAAGRRMRVIETDADGYRIAVLVPDTAPFLSSQFTLESLLAVDLLLFLMLVVLPAFVRDAIANQMSDLARRLSVSASGFRRLLRALVTPLAIASFVVFAVLMVLFAFLMNHLALERARANLSAAASDIVGDIDNFVDDQLAFNGHEICQLYGSPEKMANLDLNKLMETYFVDEINVVNGKGICVASTVPAIRGKNEWLSKNPAKFCQALLKDGKTVFSQPFRASATESHIVRKYVGVAFPPPAKGFMQIGFDRVRLANSLDYSLKNIADGWHIANSGFFLITRAKNDEIISSGRPELLGKTLGNIGFDVLKARTCQNVDDRAFGTNEFLGFKQIQFFHSRVNGEPCLCTSGVVNQYHRYVAVLPLAELRATVWLVVGITAALLFFVLVLTIAFMTRLSDLVTSLRVFIAKDKERREKDLALAKAIQLSVLPFEFPDVTTHRIRAIMETAREVGGDFFDFFQLPNGKIVFLVADVSGKGVPAALFMMRAKALLRAAAQSASANVNGNVELALAVAGANTALADSNEAEMFVTAWVGMLDLKTGDVEYVNAGHNAPIVKRVNGRVEWVRARSGLVLAAMSGAKYRPQHLKLEPGDSIFLYTDGVSEAMNAADELYGEDRLEVALLHSNEPSIDTVKRDLAAFVGETEQSDDITMLSLEFKKFGNS